MFPKVTEHLFDPAKALKKSQGHAFVGQVGGQVPGLFFTALKGPAS
jgi:hypothetical protein